MDSWTKKKGYPVVQINRFRNNLTLTQSWFLLNPTSETMNEDYKWYIPFTFTTKLQSQFEFESNVTWLTPEKSSSKLIFQLKIVMLYVISVKYYYLSKYQRTIFINRWKLDNWKFKALRLLSR